MKILILSLSLFAAQVSFAQDTTPICDFEAETEVYPCRLSKIDASEAIITMMIQNKEGMKQVQSFGDFGLILGGFGEGEEYSVIMLSNNFDEGVKMELKYEITLYDGYGVDTLLGPYKWTVLETTEGDGYTYSSTYKNEIKEINPMM